jgi:hypothetical protein
MAPGYSYGGVPNTQDINDEAYGRQIFPDLMADDRASSCSTNDPRHPVYKPSTVGGTTIGLLFLYSLYIQLIT